MKHTKRFLLTLALAFTCVLASWAQDEVTVTPTANANEWTFEMPAADVELEVEYYTDEEWLDMGEALELTKVANGEWTLAAMPAFDVELEVEYETAQALDEATDNGDALAEWNSYEADVTLTRTLQTGGHDVADDVIRFNFHEGLKNAQQHLRLFDNIIFIDGNSEYGQIIALHISKSHTHKVVGNPPLWFREQFEDYFSKL